VRLDIPHRHPARAEREDLLVEPLKPPLTLAHQPRLETAFPISGRVELHRPVLGHQRLRGRPVALVARPRRLLMTLVTQMVSQLDLQRALDQPLGQLREQTAGADDLLLGPGTRQRLVHDVIRKRRRRSSGTSSRIPDKDAGSPSGSPAPPRSKTLARTTRSTSRLVDMTLLSTIRRRGGPALTDPR
jgi:hypothetical protein